MKEKKTDILMPVFFLLLAIVIYGYCVTIPVEEAMFLMIVATVMFLCAGILLFLTFRNKKSEVSFENTEMKKVVITVVALMLYTLSLNIVGYIVDTVLLGSFIIWYLNPQKKAIPIMISIIVTVLVYIVFGILLRVPMPVPFFWR